VVQPPGGLELLHVDQEPGQHRVHQKWSAYAKAKKLPAPTSLTNDPMEATYRHQHVETGG
jgi:hypothetical protein